MKWIICKIYWTRMKREGPPQMPNVWTLRPRFHGRKTTNASSPWRWTLVSTQSIPIQFLCPVLIAMNNRWPILCKKNKLSCFPLRSQTNDIEYASSPPNMCAFCYELTDVFKKKSFNVWLAPSWRNVNKLFKQVL